jgi:hypothetical protein
MKWAWEVLGSGFEDARLLGHCIWKVAEDYLPCAADGEDIIETLDLEFEAQEFGVQIRLLRWLTARQSLQTKPFAGAHFR